MLVFDKDFNFLDGAFQRMTAVAREDGSDVPHEKLALEWEVQEAGYVYTYLSNDGDAPREVYFDDFNVTHEQTPVIQSNSYYPFGLLHGSSWTRPEALPNAFLYNASSELNRHTGNYETFFRQYDPALGRMSGIDIMAGKYSSLTPYQYAFNDPVAFNDPSGADPDEDEDVTPAPNNWEDGDSDLSRRKAIRREGNNFIIDWVAIGPHGGTWNSSRGFRRLQE